MCHQIFLPSFQVEQGSIEVNVEIMTQIMSSTASVEIEILPEGSIVHRHTSKGPLTYDVRKQHLGILIDPLSTMSRNLSNL